MSEIEQVGSVGLCVADIVKGAVAAEREACAQIAESVWVYGMDTPTDIKVEIAAAIRALGQA